MVKNMDFGDFLNENQIKAVQTTEGQIRVIAGPGSGKTMVLTSRFCHLVANLGVAPKNIICVTFTNKAANEMKSRIRKSLGDLDLGYISTLHAFCVQLLKEDIHHLQFPKNFLIIDREDQLQILTIILKEMNLTKKQFVLEDLIDEVLEAKKLTVNTYIKDIILMDNTILKEKIEKCSNLKDQIFFRYLYEQKKLFGCDFNDLINFSLYLLENFEDVKVKWQERMQYVMIDEFQDLSAKQYKLGRLLSGYHGNIFIVGDPDQTIYSWRGSHVNQFLDFPKLYPEATTIILDKNYRSTPEILTCANSLIEKNITRYPHVLSSTKDHGLKPLVYLAKNQKKEAEWILGKINELVEEKKVPLYEIGIIYRSHYLTRPLEDCFIRGGLSYRVFRGIAFYQRKEIKDLIGYLRLLIFGDDLSFLRIVNVPSRGIGEKRLEKLGIYAKTNNLTLYEALKQNIDTDLLKNTKSRQLVEAIETTRSIARKASMGDILQTLMDLSGYEQLLRETGTEERLENLAEFKRALIEHSQEEEADFSNFLDKIALSSAQEGEKSPEKVALMTVHASKGLEFAHVFVCGLNEGVFPSRKILNEPDMEEERRLFYVAITRAMDGLFLSAAEGLHHDGLFKLPSRFIFDIETDLLDYVEKLDSSMIKLIKNRKEISLPFGSWDRPFFIEGQRLHHQVMGDGTVVKVVVSEKIYVVKFDSLKTERNIRFGTELVKIE
jgi:DNA helicase-2/ATP-dependent DNA helicase PcrA